MKKVMVILGAGASLDVYNPSVQVLNADSRPPLAAELFQDRFWPQRQLYRGAVVIASELAPLATSRKPFPLEARLTALSQSPNPQTRLHFRHLAAYLRDVLIRCSQNYVTAPGTYLRLIHRLMEPMTHDIMFVVLNYDTLLERALSLYDERYVFQELDDYIKQESVKLIKVHGSTNWLVPIPGSHQSPSWESSIISYEPDDGDMNELIIDNRVA